MASYKIQYFDARGVIEVARFMFAVAKVEYEDARFPFTLGTPGDFSTVVRAEFDEAKASGILDKSCGKCPLLIVDGQPLCGQSKAIERYLARKLGLMGGSDEDAGVIDALTENVRDIKDSYSAAKRKPEGEEREKAMKEFFEETLVKWCALTEKSLPAAQSDFLVGSGISYADLAWFTFVGCDDKPFFDNVAGAQASFAECPRIKAAMAACAANPEIQAWLAKRPASMF